MEKGRERLEAPPSGFLRSISLSLTEISGVVAIVPARGGSKRVPRKNLEKVGGISLMERTANAIAGTGFDIPVVLTTDDTEIAAEGERLGWVVPFLRPADLSDDLAGTADTVLHAVDWLVSNGQREPALLLVLQVTSPFRQSEDIGKALQIMNAQPETDSVVGMTQLHVGARHVFGVGADGYASNPIGDTDDRPAFVPNGSLYLTRTKSLKTSRSFYEGNVHPLIMGSIESIDIDTTMDLAIANQLAPLVDGGQPA